MVLLASFDCQLHSGSQRMGTSVGRAYSAHAPLFPSLQPLLVRSPDFCDSSQMNDEILEKVEVPKKRC